MAEEFMANERIAAGYAFDRPRLHKQVLDMALYDDLSGGRFLHGLDVGCGAGLSAEALGRHCQKVTGVDISRNMIAMARSRYPSPVYTFLTGSAEELPLPEGVCDIGTAAGVTDWLDEEPFLRNLGGVLQSGGLLILYDFWITDRMEGNADYTAWWHGQYLGRFPIPGAGKRPHRRAWSDETAALLGFELERQETFVIPYCFEREAFVRFMLLQSNVNARIGEAAEALDESRRWFDTALRPVFNEEKKTLLFDGWYRRYIYHGST